MTPPASSQEAAASAKLSQPYRSRKDAIRVRVGDILPFGFSVSAVLRDHRLGARPFLISNNGKLIGSAVWTWSDGGLLCIGAVCGKREVYDHSLRRAMTACVGPMNGQHVLRDQSF